MLDVSYIDTSWSCPIASKNDVAFIWILPVMHAPSERINKPEKDNSRHECGYGNKDEYRPVLAVKINIFKLDACLRSRNRIR